MITIDYQNAAPIYEQIAEKFRTLIIKGVLPCGSQMPSVRSLAVSLSINPNTIQKAYALLEQQQYIFPVKGRGNFVSDTQKVLKQTRMDFMTTLESAFRHAKDIGITKQDIQFLAEQIFSSKDALQEQTEQIQKKAATFTAAQDTGGSL